MIKIKLVKKIWKEINNQNFPAGWHVFLSFSSSVNTQHFN